MELKLDHTCSSVIIELLENTILKRRKWNFFISPGEVSPHHAECISHTNYTKAGENPEQTLLTAGEMRSQPTSAICRCSLRITQLIRVQQPDNNHISEADTARNEVSQDLYRWQLDIVTIEYATDTGGRHSNLDNFCSSLN